MAILTKKVHNKAHGNMEKKKNFHPAEGNLDQKTPQSSWQYGLLQMQDKECSNL